MINTYKPLDILQLLDDILNNCPDFQYLSTEKTVLQIAALIDITILYLELKLTDKALYYLKLLLESENLVTFSLARYVNSKLKRIDFVQFYEDKIAEVNRDCLDNSERLLQAAACSLLPNGEVEVLEILSKIDDGESSAGSNFDTSVRNFLTLFTHSKLKSKSNLEIRETALSSSFIASSLYLKSLESKSVFDICSLSNDSYLGIDRLSQILFQNSTSENYKLIDEVVSENYKVPTKISQQIRAKLLFYDYQYSKLNTAEDDLKILSEAESILRKILSESDSPCFEYCMLLLKVMHTKMLAFPDTVKASDICMQISKTEQRFHAFLIKDVINIPGYQYPTIKTPILRYWKR